MLTQSMKSHKSRLERGFTSGWPCADLLRGHALLLRGHALLLRGHALVVAWARTDHCVGTH